jgi:hypothetical protein
MSIKEIAMFFTVFAVLALIFGVSFKLVLLATIFQLVMYFIRRR